MVSPPPQPKVSEVQDVACCTESRQGACPAMIQADSTCCVREKAQQELCCL